jgi:hypothetical protein
MSYMIIRQHLPFYWIILSIAVLGVDYISGPAIQFPIAFVIPVLLAAWYNGWRWGVSLAILLPIARLVFHYFWEMPMETLSEVLNLFIRIIVLAGLAVLAHYTAALTREVKVLKGILPTCSGCKKIRTEDGSWKQMEAYIAERTDAEFSHGLCDECAARMYPEYYEKMKSSRDKAR